MEVFYIRKDGVRVRGIAVQRYVDSTFWRELYVGDQPLKNLQRITFHEWLLGDDSQEWRDSAMAMIR